MTPTSVARRVALLLGVFASRAGALAPPAKTNLLSTITAFNEATAVDGNVPIDFGVKGGELDGDSRTPRNLFPDGFNAVSARVGEAAQNVMSAVDALAEEPSLAATAAESWRKKGPWSSVSIFLGGRREELSPLRSPLDGAWSNKWTTAADATFDAKSERGAARASNVVEGSKGKITNVIEFLGDDSKLDTLRVRLSAVARGPSKLELTFRYVKVTFRKRLFGIFKWILIPVA